MKFNSIKYFVKEGFTNLFRNRLMTVASIAIVSACILIMSFSYCLVSNLSYILKQIEDNVGIAVFLEDDLDADAVNEINEKINKIDHIESVFYISPDEALEEFKEEWDTDGILDGFDSENNPLSKSFEINLEDIKYQDEVLSQLESIDGIRNIRHAQMGTELLLKANKFISIFGGFVIIVLGLLSVLIIMNTIKISVFTRKVEINIMKFVGATDWFIRWPFVIEGIIIGAVGALIPLIISWPTYSQIVAVIYDKFPVIKDLVVFHYTSDIFSFLIPFSLIFGIALGVGGSIFSIRKHLRV